MKKKRKQSKSKSITSGRIIKLLGGLIGSAFLINHIEQINGVEGVYELLDLSGLIIETTFDKAITMIELLIQLGKSE